jgi:hypothetical protein
LIRRLPPLASALAAAALVLLAGCEDVPVATTPTATASTTRSAESLRLEKYYASVQSRLMSQGLMRTDGGGVDVPFTSATLVEDFEKIALYDEYTISGGRFIAQQTPSTLRRWQQPIRIGLVFGRFVSDAQRQKDTANVTAYAQRLARLTGLDIRVSNSNPNFHVLFLHRDDQASVAATLHDRIPRLSQIVVDELTNVPRNTYCVAYAFSDQQNESAYSAAVILVKAEHPDLMRLSCIHEEMAQALGLANDSPTARPSIFNDDEEFALLTTHDEMLLKMLYDRRLRTGMTPAMARPLLPMIAQDVMGVGG